MFRLDGKVAVVTGGNGVICSAVAKDLAKQGAKIALLDISEDAIEAVASEIRSNGQSDIIAVKANVLDLDSLEQAARKVLNAFGKVDILINGAGGNKPNAGTSPDLSFFDLPASALKEVYDLNFLGSVLPSQVFGKIIAEQGEGSIINFASMASFRPLTKTITYSSAKAAIVNFTQWLAVHFCQEYSPNIRVNAIAPGFLLTTQNRFLLTEENGDLTPRGESIIKNTPMGRFGNPEEMSGAVIYLCSDAAKFVTGTVIAVDGGFNAFSGV
jgi:NAD(P)-dependent dehydrogenase (short-subunit alcohol dehydrogenase family)